MSEPHLPSSSRSEPSRAALGIIFLIVLIDLMGFGIIIPLLPFYVHDPENNPMKVTLLFSVFSICQFIGAPVLGAISDRHGRKPVLALSQLGSSAGYVLLGIATQPQLHISMAMSLVMIYVARTVDGFTGGNISTAQAYISDVTTPQNRSRAMALIGAAFGLGFALGPFLGGVLGKYSVSLPAYVAAAFSMTAAILTFAKLPESRTHRPLDVEAWLHPSQFKPVLRKPALVNLLSIGFITMAAFVMMESTVGIFLEKHFNYQPHQVGWFFGYIGVIILILQGGILRRIARSSYDWPLAVTGPALVAVGMGVYTILGFHRSLMILLIAGALNAIGRSLQQPTLSALLAQNSTPEEFGVTFGLYTGLGSLARVIGPIIAGLAFPFVRNAGPFVVAGLIALAGAIWMGSIKKLLTPAARPADNLEPAMVQESS
jgi:DHA1 family tetracycline resistance protein-like MFS transporter